MTKVDCLDDLVRVVESSANVNNVQLVGDQNGESIVPMYDWVNFFGNSMKKIPLITKQHHFAFRSTSVQIREFSDSSEKVITLYTNTSYSGFSEVITPPGLSLQRKWYLHDKIREFCSQETSDLVCPKPDQPNPRSTPQPSPSSSPHPANSRKRSRVCGSCGEIGHNKRTCTKSNNVAGPTTTITLGPVGGPPTLNTILGPVEGPQVKSWTCGRSLT